MVRAVMSLSPLLILQKRLLIRHLFPFSKLFCAGLYWSTYQAVVRRDGVYNSASAGAVDFNAELLEPMEKEFSTDWQAVLDSTIQKLLTDAEKTILGLCNNASQSLAARFRECGMDAARLGTMVNTANRSTVTALKASFQQMGTTAVEAQRDLSRTLLPAVQQSMKNAYDSALMVERGAGVFNRMKGAMETTSQRALRGMFDKAMKELIDGIESVIVRLQNMISATSETTNKTMANVFSMCWDDQSDQNKFIDPEAQKKIRECRDALLPDFNKLVDVQGGACKLMGVEREEVELDVMGVETFDQTLSRRLDEAKKRGDAFDLCDSDAEVPVVSVKAEKKARAASSSNGSPPAIEIIEILSDSDDDDWEIPPPSGLSRSSEKKKSLVKSEML